MSSMPEFVQYDQDDSTAGEVVLGVDTHGTCTWRRWPLPPATALATPGGGAGVGADPCPRLLPSPLLSYRSPGPG
jgi:hypothetical protein